MKKNLLAIAVAGAMAVPTAGFAAAGPTLYGQAHISLDYIDNSETNALRTSSNTSRFGVKGAQELSDSLSAIYLFEWEVDVGNGSAAGLKNRNQYAGFKHDAFGTLVMGRHDTPTKVIGRKVDLFWSSQLGQNRAITAGNFSDARADQVVGYISPDFGPVHVFAAYIANLGGVTTATGGVLNDDDNDNNAISAALIYDQGGLFAAVSYDWFNDKGFAPAVPNGEADAPQNLRVAAKYGWNNFTVSGLFQYNNNILGTDNNQWLAGGGLAYTMGKNVLKGQVYYAGEQENIDDTEALMFGLGWDHNLSKSTAAYLTFAGIAPGSNGAAAQGNTNSSSGELYNLGGSGHGYQLGVVSDEFEWGVSAGYRIKF